MYRGPVRDGAFGNLTPETTVARCGECGVERLDENHCVESDEYETEAYRERLRQGLDTEYHLSTHDHLHRWAQPRRGRLRPV